MPKPKAKPLPRRPAPAYPASPLSKARKRVRETVENISQQGRNVRNTLSEGVRKIKRHVGR